MSPSQGGVGIDSTRVTFAALGAAARAVRLESFGISRRSTATYGSGNESACISSVVNAV